MALFTCATIGASAQTVDEVLAKHITALGGAEKLATLNTAIMEGNMSANGTDFPLTMTKTQLKGMRIDFEVMGTSNYQLANTEKAFAYMPIMQMQEPKEADAEKFKFIVPELDLQGSLYNYTEKGNTVALMPNEKVDGIEHYKIKLITKLGAEVHYFIDIKTNFISKVKRFGQSPTGGDVEASFADYKKNADGFIFPYSMTTPNGTIIFDKVNTNVKVDENLYKP